MMILITLPYPPERGRRRFVVGGALGPGTQSTTVISNFGPIVSTIWTG